MSKVKEVLMDIQEELVDAGSNPNFEAIAAKLGVPVDWVEAEYEAMTDEYYDYDGQPDEAQEWHDFDPDC